MQLSLEEILIVVKRGGVVVAPSDTVYGLMCSALSPAAVKKMYEIKQREAKPGTILAANTAQLVQTGFSEADVAQSTLYWPAAISVVLDAPESLEYLHMGLDSLAVRIPQPKWLRELLELTGPLATTSANLPGAPTAVSISEAKNIFGDKVDLYVDGGSNKNAQPSTIIKIHKDGTVETLRG